MRTPPQLGLFLLLVMGTGCDPVFGVYRHARVPFMPEPARVNAAIRATPGIDTVEYRQSVGSRPLTLTGIKPPDHVYYFIYQGDTNVHGVVQFVVDYKQGVEYSQYLSRMGIPPPQPWLDATHPVMIEIEKQLVDKCDLTNLQSTVVEDRIKVKIK
jgi:hypothetical protein